MNGEETSNDEAAVGLEGGGKYKHHLQTLQGSQDNRNSSEEVTGRCILLPVVNLLPICEQAVGSLVLGVIRSPLQVVEHYVASLWRQTPSSRTRGGGGGRY